MVTSLISTGSYTTLALQSITDIPTLYIMPSKPIQPDLSNAFLHNEGRHLILSLVLNI